MKLFHLDDQALARLVLADDPDARDEAQRRFLPLFTRYSQGFCARLSHRSNRREACPGFSGEGCDGAFVPGLRVMEARMIGVEPERRRSDKNRSELTYFLEAPRGPSGATSGSVTFAAHLKRCGMSGWQTDMLRAWNADRGLLTRPRPKAPLFAEAVTGFIEHDDSANELRMLGFDLPSKPLAWFEALYLDACQTGTTNEIDVFRTARILDGDRGRQQLMVQHLNTWARTVSHVDRIMSDTAPDYYARTLARAREMTRARVPLGFATEMSGREFDDPTWQLQDEITDDGMGHEGHWDLDDWADGRAHDDDDDDDDGRYGSDG